MAIAEQHLHIVKAFSFSHSVPLTSRPGVGESWKGTQPGQLTQLMKAIFHACNVMLSNKKGGERIWGEVDIAPEMARHQSTCGR